MHWTTTLPEPARVASQPARVAAPSVSIIIPARNERGTIASCVERLPCLSAAQEVIFVEGHSTDGTWDEIIRVSEMSLPFRVIACRQTGKGKGNAVEEGFARARGDILLILDADLSVEPEALPRFYEELARRGSGFVNGSRLTLPMERAAMPLLNRWANFAFGWLVSRIIRQRVRDSLCGTKGLWRSDYLRIQATRPSDAPADPFGDFALLFGAARVGLSIFDVPVHYRARTYGQTNIHRWRDGLRLLRLVLSSAVSAKTAKS